MLPTVAASSLLTTCISPHSSAQAGLAPSPADAQLGDGAAQSNAEFDSPLHESGASQVSETHALRLGSWEFGIPSPPP